MGSSIRKFGIQFEPRKSKKAQVYADFLADFPVEDNSWSSDMTVDPELSMKETSPVTWKDVTSWKLFTDGSVSLDGAAIGVVLVTPDNTKIELAEKLGFPLTNNEAEYEAVLSGLHLAKSIGVKELTLFTDSKLVTEQYNGGYKTSKGNMTTYLQKLRSTIETFSRVHISHIMRSENRHADALAYLAAMMGVEDTRTVKLLSRQHSFLEARVVMLTVELGASWMDPLRQYLQRGELPTDKDVAQSIVERAKQYAIINGNLYKKTPSGPLLKCVHLENVQAVIAEAHTRS